MLGSVREPFVSVISHQGALESVMERFGELGSVGTFWELLVIVS